MNTHKPAAVGAIAAALVLAMASLAWACTPQARVLVTSAQSGLAGGVVSIRGAAVTPGPVEIRWNGVKGATVGSTTADHNGDFVAAVTVPDVLPGVYTLVVATPDGPVARSAFEVTSSSQAAAPAPSRWRDVSNPRTYSIHRSSDPRLGVDTAVLAVGLVITFSVLTAATVRRRRVSAGGTIQ